MNDPSLDQGERRAVSATLILFFDTLFVLPLFMMTFFHVIHFCYLLRRQDFLQTCTGFFMNGFIFLVLFLE